MKKYMGEIIIEDIKEAVTKLHEDSPANPSENIPFMLTESEHKILTQTEPQLPDDYAKIHGEITVTNENHPATIVTLTPEPSTVPVTGTSAESAVTIAVPNILQHYTLDVAKKKLLKFYGINETALTILTTYCCQHPNKNYVLTGDITKTPIDPYLTRLKEKKKLIPIFKALHLFSMVLVSKDKEKCLFIARQVNGNIITSTITRNVGYYIDMKMAVLLAIDNIREQQEIRLAEQANRLSSLMDSDDYKKLESMLSSDYVKDIELTTEKAIDNLTEESLPTSQPTE